MFSRLPLPASCRVCRVLSHHLRRLSVEEAGFSVLELLIASALALVILTATFSMFLSSQKDATSLIAKADAAQSTNLGLYEMDEDLRQAYEIEFPVASSTVASGCPETAGVQPCNIIDVLARLPVSGGGYSDYEVRYDCTVTSTTIPTDRACWRYQCPASATTPLTSTCLATTSGVIAKMVMFWVTERTQVARYRSALEAIRDYDSFQGGPRAPRASVVENAMRELAGSALVGS